MVAFAAGGYLLGSIPFGLVIGRLVKGVDIRDYGSGKTGMTNTLRTLGKGPAAAVFLLDLLKGALPVLLAKLLVDDARVEVIGALAAIAGHDWPVYAGFRGGRGVSSSFGALLAMMPLLGIFVPFIGGVVLFPFRYVSLMSIAGTVVTGLIVFALAATNRVPDAYAVFAAVAAPLIVVLHRENIQRLLAGTEPKIGQGGSKRVQRKPYAPGGRSR
jgi:glycerol-3-phosphate acyltransferase PlsY